MLISLAGRSALITGGSQGLGLAMAKRFGEAGANVAIVARRPEVLAEAQASLEATVTGKVLSVPCDVRDPAALQAAFAAAEQAFGAVDILVNNAGGAVAKPFEKVTDEEWANDIELKLMAAIRMIRLALPGMKARRWGRIINVLNSYAKAPQPNSMPTSVTRAAGLAVTKALAGEVGPFNITVNGMLTGLFMTEQIRKLVATRGEAALDPLKARIPLGRIGDPEEFANLACFLASEEGGYVTGLGLNIDGGSSPVA